MARRLRYNHPPNWPPAPKGWTPPDGWQPDPSWPTPPAGWQFWTPTSKAPRRRRSRVIFVVAAGLACIAAAVVVLVVGSEPASSPAATTTHVPGGDKVRTSGGTPNQWLLSAPSFVLFIQWTRSGNDVSGSLSGADTSGTQFDANNVSISGTISGSSLTLKLSPALGSNATVTGQLSSSSLTLNLQTEDGSIEPYVFHPGTLNAYNTAVQALHDAANQAANEQAQAAASQSAAAAQAAQVAEQQHAIDQDAEDLAQAYGALQDDISRTTPDIGAVPKDLTHEQQDLAATEAASQAVIAEAKQYPDGNYGQVCSDAAGVSSDAAGVSSDDAGISSDAAGINDDLDAINSDETALSDAEQKYQQAQASQPGYAPSTTPVPASRVDALQAAAANTLKKVGDEMNADITSSKNFVAQATAAADAAAKAGGC